MLISVKLFLDVKKTEVCFPRRPQSQKENKMASEVKLRFVDENEFQKQGNSYILPQNPKWEINCTFLVNLKAWWTENTTPKAILNIQQPPLHNAR